jgi:hypothetical protein
LDFEQLDQEMLRKIEKDAENEREPSCNEYYYSESAFWRRQVPPGASTWQKIKRGRYNGEPDLVGALKLFDAAKYRAQKSGVEFTLRAGWIRDKIREGVCERTGIPFDLEGVYRNGRWQNPWAPSVDRVIPGGPYSPENCQIVIWEYNCQKCRSSEEEMAEKSNHYQTIYSKRDEECSHDPKTSKTAGKTA